MNAVSVAIFSAPTAAELANRKNELEDHQTDQLARRGIRGDAGYLPPASELANA